jgi:hypothetical protein
VDFSISWGWWLPSQGNARKCTSFAGDAKEAIRPNSGYNHRLRGRVLSGVNSLMAGGGDGANDTREAIARSI